MVDEHPISLGPFLEGLRQKFCLIIDANHVGNSHSALRCVLIDIVSIMRRGCDQKNSDETRLGEALSGDERCGVCVSTLWHLASDLTEMVTRYAVSGIEGFHSLSSRHNHLPNTKVGATVERVI